MVIRLWRELSESFSSIGKVILKEDQNRDVSIFSKKKIVSRDTKFKIRLDSLVKEKREFSILEWVQFELL